MKQKGGVFVLALVVLTAATTVLALTVAAQRVGFRSTVNRMEASRAKLMAASGVQRALAELALITQPGDVDQTQEWFVLGDKGNEEFVVGGESFRIQIVDASSLISLNTVTEIQLQNLGLVQDQIDSLLDWREPGDSPRAEGAKDEYYNGLERPYNARKGRLESVDEVLLVKDWLPSTLFDTPTTTSNVTTPRPLIELFTTDSFSPNTDGSGQQRQDINGAQAQQLTQAGLSPQVAQAIIARRTGMGRFSGMNQVFTTPGLDTRSAGILLDRFGAGGGQRLEGRININTATEDVLATMPGMATDIAQAIVSRQTSGFANLSEVLQVPGVTVQLLTQIADQISIGSDTFLVRCEGRAGRTKVSIEAVVQVENGTPRIVKTLDAPRTDMSEFWGWASESTTQTILGEDRR